MPDPRNSSAQVVEKDATILIFQHFNLHDSRVHMLQNYSMGQHRQYADFWGYQYITSTLNVIPADHTIRQRQMNKIYALIATVLAEVDKGDQGADWIM